MNIKHDYQEYPDSDYRYFVYDPNNNHPQWYKTVEERDTEAQSIIDSYMDDSWNEEVENVIAGEVTHTATQTDRHDRPPDSELDEDDIDESGVCWNDWAFMCKYELQPIAESAEAKLAALRASNQAGIEALKEMIPQFEQSLRQGRRIYHGSDPTILKARAALKGMEGK